MAGRSALTTLGKSLNVFLLIPNHLSNTIKAVLGKSPCPVYEEKLIDVCKEYLVNTHKPVSEIAFIFGYKAAHFTKFSSDTNT